MNIIYIYIYIYIYTFMLSDNINHQKTSAERWYEMYSSLAQTT
jgi:hypothetical protein